MSELVSTTKRIAGTIWDGVRRVSPALLTLVAVAAAIVTLVLAGLLWCLLVIIGILAVLVVGLAMGSPDPPEDAVDADDEGESTSAVPADRGGVEVVVDEAESSDTEQDQEEEPASFSEAMKGALDGNIELTRSRADEFIATVSPDEAEWARAVKEYLLVKAGDTNAIGRLKSLADAATKTSVLSLYPDALRWLGQELKGRDYVAARAENASGQMRGELLTLRADLEERVGDRESARQTYAAVVDDATLADETRARAYCSLGAIYRDDDPVLASAFYERGLSLDSARTNDRFQLAYLYSQMSMRKLAMFHYRVLDMTNRATAVALNNLAIQEQEAGLRFVAHQTLLRAVEAGSALAAGNLAHAAIGAGDLEKAEEWVAKGHALNATDARVTSAISTIADRRRQEQETSNTYLDGVEAVASAVGMIVGSGSVESIEGQWGAADGSVLELTANGGGTEYTGRIGDDGWYLRIHRTQGGRTFTVEAAATKYFSKERPGFAWVESGQLRLLFEPSEEMQMPSIVLSRVQSVE